MRKLLMALLLLLPFLAQAQTPPTPTYTAIILNPQGGTPSPAAEGKCWTQSLTGFYCYYNGSPHGPFLAPGGTIPLTVGNTTIASGTSTRVLYDNAGVLGEYTNTQLTALINSFSSTLSGAAPASGGGTTNFLRADGTWATPAGTGASVTGSPVSGNLTKFSGASSITNGDLAGDATTSGTLTVTVGKVNGVTFGASPSTNTIPVVTGANTVTYETAPVAAGGTGLTSGTSGGVLAFTASGTLASSGALTANLPVIGGGAGVAPTVGTRSGNTTQYVTTTGAQTSGNCVQIDASGNHVALGSPCGTGSGSVTSVGVSSTGSTITVTNSPVTGSGTINVEINTSHANTWGALQTFSDGDFALAGATSGTITMKAAATAGSNTITWPAGTTNFSATGGTSQVVKQTSSGGAFTVGQLGCTDLSTAGTACTQNTGTSGANVPLLNAANTWSASQAGSITTLSISGSTFTPNAANNHYYILLVHASCPCTLANPSPSFTAGTTGVIEIQQSATGSDTIGTWGSSYMAPSGTSSIVLSTGASAIDVLAYYVIDSTHILLIPSLNFSH